jgi:AcrR family transcriptional regulator
MTIPVDIQETVSPELSTVMEAVMDNYEFQGREPPTLACVHLAMAGGLLERLTADRRIRLADEPSLHTELNALIERAGDDAFAVRFMRPRASEDLSTVIEASLSSEDYAHAPTLAGVRDAMRQGLLANLAGHGQLDCVDEQSLLDEIDALVEKHGAGALAEEFLLYY